MVRLACADNPLFVIDDREIRRAGPSYSIDSVSELRAELGAELPLCFLLGADAFLGLSSWQRWQELFGLVHFVVVHRPGFEQLIWMDSMPPALQEIFIERQTSVASALANTPAGRILTYPMSPLDISATRIRVDLRHNISPRYLVPDAILNYISQNKLYSE